MAWPLEVSHVYGDGAWASAGRGVLRVSGDTLHWLSATTLVRRLGGEDATRAAAVVLLSLAASAVQACESARRVLVTGGGLVAETVRGSLPATRADEQEFDAAVETTGDAETIRRLLEELPPFGLLVLCAPSSTSPTINLYPDVHVRGVRIVGTSPPFVRDAAWTPSEEMVTAAATAPPPSDGSRVSSLWWHREIESP